MIRTALKTTALAALLASCNTATKECSTTTSKECATKCENSVTYSAYKHDGRIYVISKPETIASFKKTGHMPYTRTFIGEGPKGETIVVEVDKKDNTFADKLYTAYRVDNPYYKQIEKHGRIYVAGQKETFIGLLNTGHMPYTKTMIGAGPERKTVVFEVNKKDAALTARLIKQFNTVNGTSL